MKYKVELLTEKKFNKNKLSHVKVKILPVDVLEPWHEEKQPYSVLIIGFEPESKTWQWVQYPNIKIKDIIGDLLLEKNIAMNTWVPIEVLENTDRETINFSPEEGREIVYGDSDKYKVIEDIIVDTTRWSEIHKIIIQDKETKKFYSGNYSCGLTEMQDEQPYENEEEASFKEVFLRTKVAEVYE